MSIRLCYEVDCDGPDHEWDTGTDMYPPSGSTHGEAADRARAEDWQIGSLDLCPTCREDADPAFQAEMRQRRQVQREASGSRNQWIAQRDALTKQTLCPRCQAEPGEPCISATGRVITGKRNEHSDRFKVAEAEMARIEAAGVQP